jgi:hypothetical protein
MSLRDKVGKYIPAVATRTPLSREDTMAITPVRNPVVEWESTEGGEVVLMIPRRADRLGKLVGRLFRVPDYKEIVLDEVGASVWELCDGKHDMTAVISETSRKYKLNRREAEVSVTTYVRTLAERKLVGLMQRGGRPRNGRRK